MPCDDIKNIMCYNRGCGKDYDPESNSDDACRFHAGVPFFHDAYKGWTCCNKKCTDFTEFLNIPGCTISKHSNEKPPEPENPAIEPEKLERKLPEIKPIKIALERPSFEMPLTIMKPVITASVKQLELSQQQMVSTIETDETIINIGTPCKNGGCKMSYDGSLSDSTTCLHHPGCPIFHEGLKFWSCCQKRTSDFTAFLNQEGCSMGSHVWHKKENRENVDCRWDWHQTGNDVVIAVYSKQYCPTQSIVKLNPVRVYINLVFPQQNNATFNLDLELRGIVNVEGSLVTMFGTKIEVKLKKAELGKWEKLDIPREVSSTKKETKIDNIMPQVNALDLDDI